MLLEHLLASEHHVAEIIGLCLLEVTERLMVGVRLDLLKQRLLLLVMVAGNRVRQADHGEFESQLEGALILH